MNAQLPGTVAKIAAMIGHEKAMLLVEHAYSDGATGFVYFPRIPQPGQCLVSLVGIEASRKLADAFGGTTLKLPKCQAIQRAQRNAEVRRMVAAGASVHTIARTFHLTVRQVRNVLAS